MFLHKSSKTAWIWRYCLLQIHDIWDLRFSPFFVDVDFPQSKSHALEIVARIVDSCDFLRSVVCSLSKLFLVMRQTLVWWVNISNHSLFVSPGLYLHSSDCFHALPLKICPILHCGHARARLLTAQTWSWSYSHAARDQLSESHTIHMKVRWVGIMIDPFYRCEVKGVKINIKNSDQIKLALSCYCVSGIKPLFNEVLASSHWVHKRHQAIGCIKGIKPLGA